MDDVADGNGTSRLNRRTRRDPKRKYMDMLQQVADRHVSEICIELDDLDTVRSANEPPWYAC